MKDKSEFHGNKSTKDGLHFACKLCKKEEACRYYEANREKILLRVVKYAKTERGRCVHRKSRAKWEAKNELIVQEYRKNFNKKYAKTKKGKRVRRKAQYKRLYGITIEDYEEMLLLQKGKCAICGQKTANIKGKKMRLVVDHDHKNKKVRGLLCSNCNLMLGNARDDIEILKQAILYLKEK